MESFSKSVKQEQPLKIDIGAVYNYSPRDKNLHGNAFQAQEKELVFDIDMTDYDEVRKCCAGGKVCNLCWAWMRAAQLVVHAALTNDFGFEHILWVYSGRRGIHCWVCDQRARQLSDDARQAIVHFMTVIVGGGHGGKGRADSLTKRLHPSLLRAFNQSLLGTFEDYLVEDQGLLSTPEDIAKMLEHIPADLRAEATKRVMGRTGGDERWAALRDFINDEMERPGSALKRGSLQPVFDIVFSYTYPRLDVNVSTQMKHLLKAPFCVHPDTGRVCVPIDPSPHAVQAFDPCHVPTVAQLLAQIDDYDKRNSSSASTSSTSSSSGGGSNKPLKDYKKTQLKPHVDYFKHSFLRPLQASIKRQRHAQQQQQQALQPTAVVDF